MTELNNTPSQTDHLDALRNEFGPFLRGEKQAATAEELMKTRYAAYALGDIDYIVSSHHPDRAHEVDRANTELWSKQSEWLGLEIVSSEKGGPDDEVGQVEFVARYRLKGATFNHRERAQFQKVGGRWYFVDGKEIAGPPIRREKLPGRNEPCTCGSGKKFKKCCGRAA